MYGMNIQSGLTFKCCIVKGRVEITLGNSCPVRDLSKRGWDGGTPFARTNSERIIMTQALPLGHHLDRIILLNKKHL